MSDYCKQCSEQIFGVSDLQDLAGLSTEKDTSEGMYAVAICEGCGPTMVDHTGKCVDDNCLEKHGTK